jgi:multiple sugar transport system ATP-binding protein
MATIELRQVEKMFADFHAVKPMDLTIHDKEFVVLLGPSGCGKTTTLRMISGLETVTGGDIFLNDRQVTWRHPSDRDIAFVFQLFALYPHMTSQQNIVFPLQAQGANQAVIDQRLTEVVELLRIHEILNVRPGNLSGGDRQRVALARALVRRPAAFLMDEPLGALDADFRETMRAEIKSLHLAQAATTIYVTHDQIEAMAMADRIVVMSAAEIQQVGTPAEVYHNPSNLFVARFIGSPGMNLIPGSYSQGVVHLPGDSQLTAPADWKPFLDRALNGNGDVIVGFRPEAAMLSEQGPITGEVYTSDMHGAYAMLNVALDERGDHLAHVRAGRGLRHQIGDPVRFTIDPDMVRFFDPRTELAIQREVTQ